MTKKPRKAKTIAEALAEGMARAVEVGDCLEWVGSYGCKGAMPVVKSKELNTYTQNYAAPRLVWESKNGAVPAGKIVYRKCCNNACVNIEHLAVGTKAQWAAVRKKAGLTKHTKAAVAAIIVARRKRAKYTLEQVEKVQSLTRDGVTIAEISMQTGVGRAMIQDIRQGRAWANVGRGMFSGLIQGGRNA